MAKRSAGILLYRRRGGTIEILLVHPGGPFHAHKDAGDWSIPKGQYYGEEDPFETALREFEEETGQKPPKNGFAELTPVVQKSGKHVRAWAVEGDADAKNIVSNRVTREWPPHSGKFIEFPEVDRAGWFTPGAAREKIIPAQWALVEELLAKLDSRR